MGKCGHYYHYHCIEKWKSVCFRGQCTCPIDKQKWDPILKNPIENDDEIFSHFLDVSDTNSVDSTEPIVDSPIRLSEPIVAPIQPPIQPGTNPLIRRLARRNTSSLYSVKRIVDDDSDEEIVENANVTIRNPISYDDTTIINNSITNNIDTTAIYNVECLVDDNSDEEIVEHVPNNVNIDENYVRNYIVKCMVLHNLYGNYGYIFSITIKEDMDIIRINYDYLTNIETDQYQIHMGKIYHFIAIIKQCCIKILDRWSTIQGIIYHTNPIHKRIDIAPILDEMKEHIDGLKN
jgi:hypothetical protein